MLATPPASAEHDEDVPVNTMIPRRNSLPRSPTSPRLTFTSNLRTSVSGPERFIAKGLELIRTKQGNGECADCRAKGPAYADVANAVIICVDCRRARTELKWPLENVKFLFDDASLWTLEEVQALMPGNLLTNAKMERYRMPWFSKPTAKDTLTYRSQFIQGKYIRREFAHDNGASLRTTLPLLCRKSSQPDVTMAAHTLERSHSSAQLSGVRTPSYLQDLMEVCLSAFCESKTGWQLYYFWLNIGAGTLSFNKLRGQKNRTTEIDITNLSTVLVDSTNLGQVGDFAVVVITIQLKGRSSKGKPVMTRNMYIRDTDASEKNLVDFFVGLKRARSLLAGRPQTNEEAANQWTRTGWMCKKGSKLRHSWKKRWFVLDGAVLRYYTDPMDTYPLGEILLGESKRGYAVVEGFPGMPKDARYFTLVTPFRNYWIHAIDFKAKELLAWKTDLEGAIVSCGAETLDPLGGLSS